MGNANEVPRLDFDEILDWIDDNYESLSIKQRLSLDERVDGKRKPSAVCDMASDDSDYYGELFEAAADDYDGNDDMDKFERMHPTGAARPVSQPILPGVAERIINADRTGGNDPVARSLKAREAVRKALGDRLPKDSLERIETLAARTSVRIGMARERIDTQTRRLRGDYSNEFGYALGLGYVRRLADMTQAIADIRNNGIIEDVARSLSDMCDWIDGGFSDTATLLGWEKADELGVRVRSNFNMAWDWLYENVMSVDVPVPLRPDAVDTEGIRTHNPLALFIGARQRMERGWDDTSLRTMSGKELVTFSEALGRYAHTTVSWPDGYPETPILSDHDAEEWAGHQYWDLLSFVHGDVQGAQTTIEREHDGKVETYHSVKTNAEMGLPFASWTYDCHKAAQVLSMWAEDNMGEGSSRVIHSVMNPIDENQLTAIRKRTWGWLGANILDLT